MDERTKTIVVQRLASASGHLCGIQRMVQDGAYCMDLIRQLYAVQAALNKVSILLLEAHLSTCLMTVFEGEDIAERERVLGEIAGIFEVSTRHNYSIKGDSLDYGN